MYDDDISWQARDDTRRQERKFTCTRCSCILHSRTVADTADVKGISILLQLNRSGAAAVYGRAHKLQLLSPEQVQLLLQTGTQVAAGAANQRSAAAEQSEGCYSWIKGCRLQLLKASTRAAADASDT